MTITVVAVVFLVVLGAMMFSVSYGLRYFETKRRKQLVSVLRTVSEVEEVPVNLLMNPDERKKGDGPPGTEALTAKLNLLISESGLEWTVTRLVVTTAVLFAVGGF